MSRLVLLLLTCSGAVLLGYLFLRPATLQQGILQHAQSVTVGTRQLQVSSASADVPGVARHRAPAVRKRQIHLKGLLPAQAANPPHSGTSRGPVAIPLLRLPAQLPERVIHVPILMYHHISSAPPATELNRGLTVTDESFAGQLAYLRDHGYHTIRLRQLFAALYQRKPLPPHPIVLTFDDGYRDNYTDALPLLRRFGDVGEFNIISAYVGITLGVNSYMSWPQLRALVAEGMEIGSHTVDHQDLGTLPEDKIRFELRDSRNILQQTLHVPVQFLTYPAGEPFVHGSIDAQQEVLKLMPQYGYVGALLDGPLTTSTQDAHTPFQLQRIRVPGGVLIADFAAGLEQ